MNTPPPDPEKVHRVKLVFIWLLAITSLTAVAFMLTWVWLDAQKPPTIILLGTPQTEMVLEMRGAVATPGVVYLQPGDRMIDAVHASGGFDNNADQSLVNLSSRVFDGQIIVIPTSDPGASSDASVGRLNINTASFEQLKQLPGIGDVLAARIITYREFNGPFQNVDELTEVNGISANLLETLRPIITVSTP